MGETIGGFSGAKARMLGIAGIIVVLGVLLNAGHWMREGGVRWSPSVGNSAVESEWTSNSRVAVAAGEKAQTWGDAATRLGLCFIGAMVVGSLLRASFKTMISIIALAFAVIWFLQYRNIIEAPWQNLYSSFADMKTWLAHQTNSIRDFLKGDFPAVAATLVGFGIGLRR